MSKYIVECQTLVVLEIEADSETEAEQIAGVSIIEKCLYNADDIEWLIMAYTNEKYYGTVERLPKELMK